MIDLVEDVSGAVAAFVGSHMPGGDRGFGKSSAIGYVLDGDLIGGTVYHNYNPEAGVVEMSTATKSPRWLTREVLHAIFAIPFDQWGCQLVVLRVSERNTRMVQIAQRFGFEGHLIPRLRGREENEWVFTLTDDAWRQTEFERSRNG